MPTTPQPPASRPMTPAGFLSRMPAGGTVNRTPDPLLAAAVADGSHALAVEDRETEIRREVIEFIGERFYAIAWPSKTEVLNAAAHIAAAREAALQAEVTAIREELSNAYTAHGRDAAKLNVLQARIDAEIAGYMIIGPDSGGKMQADWDGEVHRDFEDSRAALAECHRSGYPDYELFEMRRVPTELAGDTTEAGNGA